MEGLRIGQLAALSGCTVKAVRFYEAKGLLPTPARTPSGYRLYTERDLRRLQFIQRAKLIGLPLAKIKKLVVHVNEEECACATMRPELEQLIHSEVKQLGVKLDQLSLLKAELESLLSKIRRGRRSLPRELCVCAEDGSTRAGRLLAIMPERRPVMNAKPKTSRLPVVPVHGKDCGDGSCGCGCGIPLPLATPTPTQRPRG